MSIHTQCLNLLIIFLTLNPTILAQTIVYTKNNREIKKLLKALMCMYMFIIFCIYILKPGIFNFCLPIKVYWYFVAILFIPIVLLGEICIGYLCIFLKGGQVKDIKLKWSFGKNSYNVIFMTALIGALEEIVYRHIWFYIFLYEFKIHIVLVIIATSIVYALNHIMMGKEIFFQKILSGILYGCLFYFSGGSVIVPIITHSVQNIFVLLKGGE